MRHDDEKAVKKYYLPEELFIIETTFGQMVLIIVEGEYDEIYTELVLRETD